LLFLIISVLFEFAFASRELLHQPPWTHLTKRWSEPLTGVKIYCRWLQKWNLKHSSLSSAVAQLVLVRCRRRFA